MTQEQALAEFRILYPGRKTAASRERFIGEYGGHMNTFNLWTFDPECEIVAQSNTSWDHAVALARVKVNNFAPDDSPVTDEVSA